MTALKFPRSKLLNIVRDRLDFLAGFFMHKIIDEPSSVEKNSNLIVIFTEELVHAKLHFDRKKPALRKLISK